MITAREKFLNLDELLSLERGDRVIVEQDMGSNTKQYERGLVIRGLKDAPHLEPCLVINNELSDRGVHSSTTLYSVYLNPSGKYKDFGDERHIYRDTDLSKREYSYPYLNPSSQVDG
jgi:hypothetical protein